MSDPQLTRIAVMSDSILAEVLRGLLEAQNIPVMLSKEGASIAYGLNVGKFAEVEVFVPARHAEQAKQIYLDNFTGED
ncbi:MAG: DUF2007 domain-containing protein [Anaerolineales bacterium]|nr:DUF2007 domain-containing protein [Anaerolineales bacterium]